MKNWNKHQVQDPEQALFESEEKELEDLMRGFEHKLLHEEIDPAFITYTEEAWQQAIESMEADIANGEAN
tara:strand:- start:24 stop:233 length:210 start_codon:yes stop_codon:yes gene_type:complete